MNNLKNLVVPLFSLVAALAIVGGAAYAYEKETASTRQADQLITSVQDQFRQKGAAEQRQAALAQARASLDIAISRLDQLRAAFSPVAAIDTAYATFSKDAAALTAAAGKISGPVAPKIAAAEQGLADTLQAWQILLSTIPSSGPDATQIAQAEKYTEQAQGYVDQIKTVADGLSPSDSGLTQSQIDAYRQVVDASAGSADTTSGDLAVALPPPPPSDTTTPENSPDTGSDSGPPGSSGASNDTDPGQTGTNGSTDQSGNQTNGANGSSSPSAGDIAAQQQAVDDLQNQVDQLQQQASSTPDTGSGTTAPSGTLDTAPPPAIQYDIYGRPKLIQGANTI